MQATSGAPTLKPSVNPSLATQAPGADAFRSPCILDSMELRHDSRARAHLPSGTSKSTDEVCLEYFNRLFATGRIIWQGDVIYKLKVIPTHTQCR